MSQIALAGAYAQTKVPEFSRQHLAGSRVSAELFSGALGTAMQPCVGQERVWRSKVSDSSSVGRGKTA